MPLTLTQLTGDFIAYAKGEQGLTKSTVYTYRSWLNSFLRWLDANGHADALDSLTTPVLRTFVYSLTQRGLRPRTVRSAFLSIKSLATFLVSHHVLTENPCAVIGLPKKDAAQRATVTTEEAVALREGAARMFPERKRLLAEAMIATLTQTGMRFSEWLDLRVQDVCLADKSLLVANGKGRRSRTLYPPPECLSAIKAWLGQRETMHCSHDWLWAEHKSRRVHDVGARKLLETVKAAAGLAAHDNIKPHALRHCFATRMLANGAGLLDVQSALGHTDIRTTVQYTHIHEQQARRMAEYGALTPPAPTRAETAPVTKGSQSRFLRRRRSGH